VQGTLEADGRVAWLSPQPPWRAGIAFLDEGLAEAAAWMGQVRAAAPESFSRPHAPARVSLEATVYLGQVPRLPDFSDEDLALLRQVGSGLRLCDLRCASAQELRALQRRFFALLEQGNVTVLAEKATHPRSWKAILGDSAHLGASPATTPEPAPRVEPVVPAVVPEAPSPSAARARPEPSGRPGVPPPDFGGAGGGWRAPSRARSADAETLYRQGLAETEAGRANRALGFLRQALALAPGDSEIAGAIGRAMRGG
jgi:hypothetical protein